MKATEESRRQILLLLQPIALSGHGNEVHQVHDMGGCGCMVAVVAVECSEDWTHVRQHRHQVALQHLLVVLGLGISHRALRAGHLADLYMHGDTQREEDDEND